MRPKNIEHPGANEGEGHRQDICVLMEMQDTGKTLSAACVLYVRTYYMGYGMLTS
jgi:hypothetical protein